MHRSNPSVYAPIGVVAMLAIAAQVHGQTRRPPTPIIPPSQGTQAVPPRSGGAAPTVIVPPATPAPAPAAPQASNPATTPAPTQPAAAANSTASPRFDGSMGLKSTTEYSVPVKGGVSTGVLTLPKDVQIGEWISGSTKAVSQDSNPLLSKLATDIKAPPALTPIAASDQALTAARLKYPASDGWREMKLADGGVVFAKATLCESHSLVSALNKVNGGDLAHATPMDGVVARPANDLGIRAADDTYRNGQYRGTTGGGPITSHTVPGTPSAPSAPVDDSGGRKYTIAPDASASQASDIRESMSATKDDGRYARALALTQMAQASTWNEGVAGLAEAYLANPTLVSSKFEEDFGDLDDAALRKMLTRVVAEANKQPDAPHWTAVAAIMAAQDRPARAMEIVERAKQAAPDNATLDRLDALTRALRKAVKATPHP